MDESITNNDLREAVAGVGDCPPDDVRMGDIRKNNVGLGSV